MTERDFGRYLITVGLFGASLVALVLAVNLLVDPLWYVGGNRIGERNYGFDERLAKTHLLFSREGSPECLIFGSSRSTLLAESEIESVDCFNYSFSNGAIGEFLVFARYAIDVAGAEPETVIVGVDGFNFSDHSMQPSIPAFVRKGETPDHFFTKYLSVDVLEFSLRSLLGRVSYGRYYDVDFGGRVAEWVGDFEAPAEIDLADPHGCLRPGASNRAGPFEVDRSARYQALREILGPDRFVGYVPPLSRCYVEHLAATGHLDGYLDAIHAAAANFDVFLDFAIPSATTSDPRLTYDGSHFRESVNRKIAKALDGQRSEFGLDVKALGRAEYGAAYRDALGRP